MSTFLVFGLTYFQNRESWFSNAEQSVDPSKFVSILQYMFLCFFPPNFLRNHPLLHIISRENVFMWMNVEFSLRLKKICVRVTGSRFCCTKFCFCKYNSLKVFLSWLTGLLTAVNKYTPIKISPRDIKSKDSSSDQFNLHNGLNCLCGRACLLPRGPAVGICS